ncbi:MAG: TIGR02452 family protein [Lachnospiraceae bacterium]|nr:TIGR02452 family protein [Lachnospiraceae bacterium]
MGQERRDLLIEAFEDTMRMVKENTLLAQKTETMQAGTLLYLPGFDARIHREKSRDSEIEVVEDTTFHAAQMLLEEGAGAGQPADTQAAGEKGRVAVLNFANAYHPGGGVKHGAMAQEECLCRSSNLYSGLTLPYLIRNYYKDNQRTTGDRGTDKVIWSPGVTVFKSDDAVPVMLDHFFEVDVLTCAAPYYDINKKHPIPLAQLEDVFYHRILNILEVAVANDVDSIVLGAFGCGAFNNPPGLVAEAFYRVLVEKQYRNYFRRIVFAIKKNDRKNTNLQAFRMVLTAEHERFSGLVTGRF